MPGRYTLLLFWSPTCGHCRDIIPDIYRVFNSYADSLDLTAYAILSEPDEATVSKWKKFLTDHHIDNPRWINLNGGEANIDWREVYDVQTTPQIYLIENEKHTFVAKKLNAKIFNDICKQLK
jgi:thiol-disulfide isomerase/thioredoxin